MSNDGFLYLQVYKNRAEALEKLIHAKNLPVSQGKFYPDCLKYGLIQPSNKSLHLADVLNYVEKVLHVDPVTGKSLIEIDHGKELAALELEEKRLKVDKLKREGCKEDRDYLKREKVEEREGALVGSILNETRYQFSRAEDAIMAIVKGDPTRKPELRRVLEETLFSSFRTIYEAGEIDITFDDEVPE
jgi:hypothetical protein